MLQREFSGEISHVIADVKFLVIFAEVKFLVIFAGVNFL